MDLDGVVDADGHVSEPGEIWERYLPPDLHRYAPQRVRDETGLTRLRIADELMPPIPTAPEWSSGDRPTGGADPKARLADMDAEGIERSILFPTTGLFFGGIRSDQINTALCRAYNDWLADFCSVDPSRLLGIAVVPQGDVGAAAEEARRACTQYGYRGVMVRPNPIKGRNLDDPAYEPLWDAVEELGVPLAIHEGTTQNVVQSGTDRFENFGFRHVCSHPHEQQMGCLALTCGGVLERHPDLRVVFLESGCGWVPYWLERLDEHMHEWGHTMAPLPLAPSEYFARQCFVSTEPTERSLPAVVSLIGDDGIIFASDYPHPDGIFPGVVRALADRADVSAATKTKILATNSVRCFSLG